MVAEFRASIMRSRALFLRQDVKGLEATSRIDENVTRLKNLLPCSREHPVMYHISVPNKKFHVLY